MYKAACSLNDSLFIGKNDNTLYCFGENDLVCGDPDQVESIVAGKDYYLALYKSGEISSWGNIFSNSGSVYDSIKQEMERPPAGLNNVYKISAGEKHALAIHNNGKYVVAWGRNIENQCNIPDNLARIVSINDPVSQVAAGFSHSLALLESGALIAWGDPIGQPPHSLSENVIIDISTKGKHSLALLSTGEVMAWGDITDLSGSTIIGQAQSYVPSGLNNVDKISAGFSHCLALKSDGTVVAWGDNSYGQCDVPAGLSDVYAICAGYKHSLAIKNDGSLVGWGENSFGQCNSSKLSNLQKKMDAKIRVIKSSTYVLDKTGDLTYFGTEISGAHGTVLASDVSDIKVFDAQDIDSNNLHIQKKPAARLYKKFRQYIPYIGTGASLNTEAENALSIEFWCYPVGTQTNGAMLISDRYSSGSDTVSLALGWFNESGISGFNFGSYYRSRTYSGCTLNTAGITWKPVSLTGSPSINQWNHVLISMHVRPKSLVISKQTITGYEYNVRVYLNGSLKGESTSSLVVPKTCIGSTVSAYDKIIPEGVPSNMYIDIGRRWDQYWNESSYFNGYIDSIVSYNTPVTVESFTPKPRSYSWGDEISSGSVSAKLFTGDIYSRELGVISDYSSGLPSYLKNTPVSTGSVAAKKNTGETLYFNNQILGSNKYPVFEDIIETQLSAEQLGLSTNSGKLDLSEEIKLTTINSDGNYSPLRSFLSNFKQSHEIISIHSTSHISDFFSDFYNYGSDTDNHIIVRTKNGLVPFMSVSTSSSYYDDRVKIYNYFWDYTFLPGVRNTHNFFRDAYRRSTERAYTPEVTNPIYSNSSEFSISLLHWIFNDINYGPPLTGKKAIYGVMNLPRLCCVDQHTGYISGSKGSQILFDGNYKIYAYINNFISDSFLFDLTINVSGSSNEESSLFNSYSISKLSLQFNKLIVNQNVLPVTPPIPVSGVLYQGVKLNLSVDFDGRKDIPRMDGEYIVTVVAWRQRSSFFKTFIVKIGGQQNIGGYLSTRGSSTHLDGRSVKFLRLNEPVKKLCVGDHVSFEKMDNSFSVVDFTTNSISNPYSSKKINIKKHKIICYGNNSYSKEITSDEIYVLPIYYTQQGFTHVSNSYKILFKLPEAIGHRDFNLLFRLNFLTTGTPSFDSGLIWTSDLNFKNSDYNDKSISNGFIHTKQSPYYLVKGSIPPYFDSYVPLYNHEVLVDKATYTESSPRHIYRSIHRQGSSIYIKDGLTNQPDGTLLTIKIEDYIFIEKYICLCWENEFLGIDQINLTVGQDTIDYTKPFKPIRLNASNINYDGFTANFARSAESDNVLIDVSTDLNFSELIRDKKIVEQKDIKKSGYFPDGGSGNSITLNNASIAEPDKLILEGTNYYYRVAYFKKGIQGEYSDIKSITIPYEKIKLTLSVTNFGEGGTTTNIIEENTTSTLPMVAIYRGDASRFTTISNELNKTVYNLIRSGSSITNDSFIIKVYYKGANTYSLNYEIKKYPDLVSNPIGLISDQEFITSSPHISTRQITFSENVRDINIDLVVYPIRYMFDFVVARSGLFNFNGFKSVNSFFINKGEVTVREWERVRQYVEARDLGYIDLPAASGYTSLDEPISNVNWYDVIKWCNAKSEMDWLSPVYTHMSNTYRSGEHIPKLNILNSGYRIPTNIEWDYAANGGRNDSNYLYSGSNQIDEVAWTSSNSSGSAQEVSKLKVNQLAVYDMSGNVSEWVWDGHENTPEEVNSTNENYFSTILSLNFELPSTQSYSLFQPINSYMGEESFTGSSNYTFLSYVGFKIGPGVRILNCNIKLIGSFGQLEYQFGALSNWNLIKYFSFHDINITSQGIGRTGSGSLGNGWSSDVCGFYLDIPASAVSSSTEIIVDYEYTTPWYSKHGVAFWSSVSSGGGITNDWIGTWDNASYARLPSNLSKTTVYYRQGVDSSVKYNRRIVVKSDIPSQKTSITDGNNSLININDNSMFSWVPTNYNPTSSTSSICSFDRKKFGERSLQINDTKRSGLTYNSYLFLDFCLGFSVDMWIYFDGFGSNTGVPRVILQFRAASNNDTSLQIEYNSGDYRLHLSVHDTSIYSSEPINNLLSNRWAHLAWSYSPDTYQHNIYIDGLLVLSGVAKIKFSNSSIEKKLYIGVNGLGHWSKTNFNGFIDELNLSSSNRYVNGVVPPVSPYSVSNALSSTSLDRFFRGGDFDSSSTQALLSNKTNFYKNASIRDSRTGFRLAKTTWSSSGAEFKNPLSLERYKKITSTFFVVYTDFFNGGWSNLDTNVYKIQISYDNGITWVDVIEYKFYWSYGIDNGWGFSVKNVPTGQDVYIIAKVLYKGYLNSQISNTLIIDNKVNDAPVIYSIKPISYIVRKVEISYTYLNHSDVSKYVFSINDNISQPYDVVDPNLSSSLITIDFSNASYGIWNVDISKKISIRATKNDGSISTWADEENISFDMFVPVITKFTVTPSVRGYALSVPVLDIQIEASFGEIQPFSFYYSNNGGTNWSNPLRAEYYEVYVDGQKVTISNIPYNYQTGQQTLVAIKYDTIWGNTSAISNIVSVSQSDVIYPVPNTPKIIEVEWIPYNYLEDDDGELNVYFEQIGPIHSAYGRASVQCLVSNNNSWVEAVSTLFLETGILYRISIPLSYSPDPLSIKLRIGTVYTLTNTVYSTESDEFSFNTVIPESCLPSSAPVIDQALSSSSNVAYPESTLFFAGFRSEIDEATKEIFFTYKDDCNNALNITNFYFLHPIDGWINFDPSQDNDGILSFSFSYYLGSSASTQVKVVTTSRVLGSVEFLSESFEVDLNPPNLTRPLITDLAAFVGSATYDDVMAINYLVASFYIVCIPPDLPNIIRYEMRQDASQDYVTLGEPSAYNDSSNKIIFPIVQISGYNGSVISIRAIYLASNGIESPTYFSNNISVIALE